MTLKPFLRFMLAFCVIYGFMIATVIAEPKWKDEVGIAAWCYSLLVMKAIIKADLAGDSEVALGLFRTSLKKGLCRRIPIEAAAFKPKEVVETIKLPDGSSFSIVKGNVIKRDNSLGDEAFVMVQDTKLPEWQLDKSTKFPKIGPQFGGGTLKVPVGWQNI